MAFEEITYTLDDESEIMVDVEQGGPPELDGCTPIDVYTYADELTEELRAVTCWKPGRNPLFVHAADPVAAYAHVLDHWIGSTADYEEERP